MHNNLLVYKSEVQLLRSVARLHTESWLLIVYSRQLQDDIELDTQSFFGFIFTGSYKVCILWVYF